MTDYKEEIFAAIDKNDKEEEEKDEEPEMAELEL